jgi:hypothetical protein
VLTELIALCVLMCVSSVALPGRTPSQKSPTVLGGLHAVSHSARMAWRMVVFVVAIHEGPQRLGRRLGVCHGENDTGNRFTSWLPIFRISHPAEKRTAGLLVDQRGS